MLAVCLLVAILYGMTAPVSKPLAFYLWAQFAATIVLYGFPHPTHLEYAALYSIFTALILIPVCLLAWETSQVGPMAWLAELCSLGVSGCFVSLTLRGIPKPGLYDWIHLCEAFVLLASGLVIGAASPYREGRDRTVALSLGIMWIVQAGFRLGFILNWPSPAWVLANQWIPAWIVISGLLWIGWRMRIPDPIRR